MKYDPKDVELMGVLKAEIDKLTNTYEKIIKIRDAKERQELQLEVLGQLSIFLAHEIRNPLGAILLYADVLKKSVEGDREKSELTQKIIDCVSRLNGLIQNMLTFGKELKLNSHRQPVANIIENCLGQVARQMEDKKISVRKDLQDLIVNCDSFWMERVFLNIIYNAMEVMNSGGELCIRAFAEENKGVIAFSDTGPGLSEGDFQNLFNIFYTTKKNGSGIGLAIVSRIVKAHGGIITAYNNEKGDHGYKGATFKIELPA